jgi:hypothetical protein
MRRHYDDDPYDARHEPLTRAQMACAAAIVCAGVLLLAGLCALATFLADGVASMVAVLGCR